MTVALVVAVLAAAPAPPVRAFAGAPAPRAATHPPPPSRPRRRARRGASSSLRDLLDPPAPAGAGGAGGGAGTAAADPLALRRSSGYSKYAGTAFRSRGVYGTGADDDAGLYLYRDGLGCWESAAVAGASAAEAAAGRRSYRVFESTRRPSSSLDLSSTELPQFARPDRRLKSNVQYGSVGSGGDGRAAKEGNDSSFCEDTATVQSTHYVLNWVEERKDATRKDYLSVEGTSGGDNDDDDDDTPAVLVKIGDHEDTRAGTLRRHGKTERPTSGSAETPGHRPSLLSVSVRDARNEGVGAIADPAGMRMPEEKCVEAPDTAPRDIPGPTETTAGTKESVAELGAPSPSASEGAEQAIEEMRERVAKLETSLSSVQSNHDEGAEEVSLLELNSEGREVNASSRSESKAEGGANDDRVSTSFPMDEGRPGSSSLAKGEENGERDLKKMISALDRAALAVQEEIRRLEDEAAAAKARFERAKVAMLETVAGMDIRVTQDEEEEGPTEGAREEDAGRDLVGIAAEKAIREEEKEKQRKEIEQIAVKSDALKITTRMEADGEHKEGQNLAKDEGFGKIQVLEGITAKKTNEDVKRAKELERIAAERMDTIERLEEKIRDLETVAVERAVQEEEALANHPGPRVSTVASYGINDNHNDRLETFSFAPVHPPSQIVRTKDRKRIADEPVEQTINSVNAEHGPTREVSLSSVASTVSIKTRNDRIREATERTDPRLVHPDGIDIPRLNKGGDVVSSRNTDGHSNLPQRIARIEKELGIAKNERDVGTKPKKIITKQPVKAMINSGDAERVPKPPLTASLSSMASSISIMTGNERAREAMEGTNPRSLDQDGGYTSSWAFQPPKPHSSPLFGR